MSEWVHELGGEPHAPAVSARVLRGKTPAGEVVGNRERSGAPLGGRRQDSQRLVEGVGQHGRVGLGGAAVQRSVPAFDFLMGQPSVVTSHSTPNSITPHYPGAQPTARSVQALHARNALLTMLEQTREQQGITKRTLAERAGLEASSVRRLLTSETANPTTENAFRLMAAMGITLEATLPTGERVQLVTPSRTPDTDHATAA
jgi:DNA-binding phage protein